MSATINPLLLQQTAEKLQALFQDFSPAESREQLWQLFSLTISGAFNHQSVAERQDLLVFYGHLQEVLVTLEQLLAPTITPQNRGAQVF